VPYSLRPFAQWSSVSSCTTGNLNGVWGSGPGDVWAVGDVGTILERSP